MASTAAVGLCWSHPSTLSFSPVTTQSHLCSDDPLVLCRTSSNHDFVSYSYTSARSSCGQTSASQDPSTASEISGQGTRMERLWQDFFSDPSQWWDYRLEKKNSKYPDFKHKTTKEALWIDNRLSPPWVQARLAAMAQGQAVRIEQLWQEFFSDPPQWWDDMSDKVLQIWAIIPGSVSTDFGTVIQSR